MTITITIPSELGSRLSEEAQRRGTTPEIVALNELERRFPAGPSSANGNSPKNLLEALGDFVGGHDGPAEPIGRNAGDRFTEILEDKRRRGKL